MPYVNKHCRELIEYSSDATGMSGLSQFIKKLDRLRSQTTNKNSVGWHPGTLNYIITRLCDYWCRDSGEANYEKYNMVIGVLECVKQEFYRRQVAPYEDEKCEENGDVYYE